MEFAAAARRSLGRSLAVGTATMTVLYMTAVTALAAPGDEPRKYNPLEDVSPGLGPLDDVIGSKIGVVLSIIWALAVIGCIIYLIRGGFMLARASARRTPDGLGHAGIDLGLPLAALVFCSILPFVVNAVQS